VELLAGALNSHLELQRYKILFISGRSSSRLNRNITELEVRRAFTVFQLMTILEENHHSFLIVEHDPLLYEDAGERVEYLAQVLKQTSREATILLYAPALDPHLQKITELADRVFCIYSEQAPAKGRKAEAKTPGAQATLEAYSCHEVALEAAESDRAQADGKQGNGAANGQGDPGGGLRCPAR
jgi:hypothetical protein